MGLAGDFGSGHGSAGVLEEDLGLAEAGAGIVVSSSPIGEIPPRGLCLTAYRSSMAILMQCLIRPIPIRRGFFSPALNKNKKNDGSEGRR